MNISNFSLTRSSGYKGSVEAWLIVWKQLADLFKVSLQDVDVFKAEDWILVIKKHTDKEIPNSLKDFINSNGPSVIQEIFIAIDPLWERGFPNFFIKNPFVVLGDEFDDSQWGLNDYITDLSDILDSGQLNKFFFDFEDWENNYEMPIEYFEIIKKSIAFAENILGNGELFWMSPNLSYSDGEWDMAGYYSSDCEFTRLDNVASLIFYVIRGVAVSGGLDSNLISQLKDIFSQNLIK